jgi:hypothetical protein
MYLLSKITGTPFISKIYLDFNGNLIPVKNEVKNNFSGSIGNQYTWKSTHFSKNRVVYTETERETNAGSKYLQRLQIVFPNHDSNRSERIDKIKQAKFVRIELSNGVSIVLGRNDFYQNRKLKINHVSDALKTNITFSCETIFSSGILKVTDVSNIIDFLIPTHNPQQFIAS